MMFVANNQDAGGTAYSLKSVKQSLYGSPGRTYVEAQRCDISIPGGDLAHESPGNLPKIVRPLVYNLCAGRDDDNPIDLSAGKEVLCDRAGRKRFTRPRSGIYKKMAVAPILDEPVDGLLQGILLPWPKAQHVCPLFQIASNT
jgi:hypothetical protein